MLDGNPENSGPQRIVGLEVWTGDHSHVLPNGDWAYATEYYSVEMEGIQEIGSDGYSGGTYWIRYENGETHAYMENAVRRVVLK